MAPDTMPVGYALFTTPVPAHDLHCHAVRSNDMDQGRTEYMSMNDEQLSGANEYAGRGGQLADQDFERAQDDLRAAVQETSDGATPGVSDATTEYGNTAVGTGSTSTGTTTTTVDAGQATMGMGAGATGPGGSTTLGSGDSMDDGGYTPGGVDDNMIRATQAGARGAADDSVR